MLGKPVPVWEGNTLAGDPGVGFEAALAAPSPTKPAFGCPGTPQDLGMPNVSAGSNCNVHTII